MVFIIVIPIFSCCSNSINSSKSNELIKYDSIKYWIEQSKLYETSLTQRANALENAHNLTSEINQDSIKLIYFEEIAFQAESQNIDSLFIKVNRESLDLALKLTDYFKMGYIYWNYGNYYTDIKVVDSAYFHYSKAYSAFKKAKDNPKYKFYSAKMLFNMGFILSGMKDYTGSEVALFEAIPAFEKENKFKDLYQCYNLLGIIYYNLEEFDKAVYYHNKALEFLEKVEYVGNSKEVNLSNLGLVYQKLKNYGKALENFNKSMEYRNLKNQDPKFYASLIDNIAYTKFLRGDAENIKDDLYNALKIRDSLNYLSGVVVSKRHLSEFYALKKDTIKAISLANDAFNLAGEVGNNRDKLETLLLLANVDKKNAGIYLTDYVKINDSLQVQERKIRNKFTRIRFETDEYIQETEKLSQQKLFISLGGFLTILFLSFAYVVRVQRIKNKELLFEKEQQKANEEIYSLMLKQQTKLEEGRLRERHRISEDLHDGVLGKIFGTRLGLGFLSVKGDEETITKLDTYIDELQNIEKEIRSISHELKNDILSSKEDFFNIIEDLIEKKSNLEGLEWEFDNDEEIHWELISDSIKINFYRIIQEALQNVIKYAEASKIKVAINLIDKNIELVIKDNGKGFDETETRKGIGLKNMKSRASKLDGSFKVITSINEGTTIYINCPIL
ncbi:tetratricopeptide repeat-containing sensor histidine kinase [Lutibacter citreus]|uniref:tetratricopeptide repeat-containing sensor histidine kinase n=1 Tax=Lutibacter citreus TaxID=2138210 RepID=UPI000DBE1C8D|nr:sensor histidine kinase [Lutibacter citreus]